MILYIKKDYDSSVADSESLAKRCISLYMNEKNTSASYDAEDFSINKTDKGKPYIEKGPSFSVSHTANVWACLVSEFNVGFDIQIEKLNVKFEAIAKRFFEEREREYVEKTGIKGFYQVWTAREAYAKYTGEGFFGKSMSDFSLADFMFDNKNVECSEYKIQFVNLSEVYYDDKLYCAICLPIGEEFCVHNIRVLEI